MYSRNLKITQKKAQRMSIQGGKVRKSSKVPGLYKKNQKLDFFCKHFIGPLRTEYNDLHDQEDYRMTFLSHPSVWR